MSEFAAAARRLFGVVAIQLGWRPEEFWRATPDELAAVFEALGPGPVEPVDVGALMRRFPDGIEPAPPPGFAWSPSPSKLGEDCYG